MFFFFSFLRKVIKGTMYGFFMFENFFSLLIKRTNLFIFLTYFFLSSFFQFFSLYDIWVENIQEGREEKKKFFIFYRFTSKVSFCNIIVKSVVGTIDGKFFFVESISNFFLSGDWLEREIWDMFGIFFLNHPDLRRIVTDYSFSGFPLRKDFSLIGYKELFYNDDIESLEYVDIDLNQKFRIFHFKNPWY